ncbi:MAG: alpha-mannosidase [Lachnospiraceae bacterium]|nr:alpha-mannosidase [Lachnospiraceae bacterium]
MISTPSKKEIYLICNAHLDPVWLWRREEGMAEAISTFRVAADFCEKYDGFIFNHNESVLYEWIQEYEPELFERIRRLVKEGKWRIMGGWYLQPDCNLPSGESFIRQIEEGNRFFRESFGTVPVTAVNFDPFGHTRGLVQILKKMGYENYVFMRPNRIVPEQDFIWRGYDGSEIRGHCLLGVYNSPKGAIEKRLDPMVASEQSRIFMCWGVGNHGGGPSEEDWLTIQEYMKAHPEISFIPSGCEEYFAAVGNDGLRVYDGSMRHWAVGCYTTMSRIKRKHRLLENELAFTERIMAAAGMPSAEKLREAEKDLLFSEFHDSLPGSMIRSAEEDMLRQMDHGLEILSRNRIKAFFRLCEGQPVAKSGEIPVMVFNPHPYRIRQEIEVEFQLQEQNFNMPEVTVARVRAADGTYLPAQNIKEDCTFNLDWRKRIVFTAELEPMSISRFDCELHTEPLARRPIEALAEENGCYVFRNGRVEVLINKSTGLIDRYRVDGRDRLQKGSCEIRAFLDNEDPWGMTVDSFRERAGEFRLLSDAEANAFNGYPDETVPNVRVIENGEVLTRLQAIFAYCASFAVVTYSMYKNETHIDVHIKLFSEDADRMYKLALPTECGGMSLYGQDVFGREELPVDGREVCFQKWCGFTDEKSGFAVINAGTYGGSCEDGTILLSLLRTPVYSAHPIPERQLADRDIYLDHVDMGEREFDFRLTAETKLLDRDAEIYSQSPYALSFFPSGGGEKKGLRVEMDNPYFILSGLRLRKDGTPLVRVFNSSEKTQSGTLRVGDREISITLGAYSFENIL